MKTIRFLGLMGLLLAAGVQVFGQQLTGIPTLARAATALTNSPNQVKIGDITTTVYGRQATAATNNVTYTSLAGYYTNTTTHNSLSPIDPTPNGYTWVLLAADNSFIAGTFDPSPAATFNGDWLLADGSTPFTFSTTYGTNTQSDYYLGYIETYFTNRTVYFSPYGNDTSGKVGNPFRPFVTPASQTGSNWVYRYAAGNYSAGSVTFDNWSTVLGDGAYCTSVNITPTFNGKHDLTIENIGIPQQTQFQNCTNVTLNHVNIQTINTYLVQNLVLNDVNVSANLANEGVYFQGYFTCIGYNSTFTAVFPVYDDATVSAGAYGTGSAATNSTAFFYNCNFLKTTNGGSTDYGTMQLGPSHLYMYGGTVSATFPRSGYSAAVNAPLSYNTNGFGTADFWFVNFFNTNSTGTNYIIYNPGGVKITLHYCAANTNLIYDPSNAVTIIGTLLAPPAITYGINPGQTNYNGSGNIITATATVTNAQLSASGIPSIFALIASPTVPIPPTAIIAETGIAGAAGTNIATLSDSVSNGWSWAFTNLGGPATTTGTNYVKTGSIHWR